MSNYYEYRLHQIDVLLSAYNGEPQFKDEIESLEAERQQILLDLKFIE